MADVVSIILCGKTEQIGKAVIEGLKPEIEGRPIPPSHSQFILL